MELVIPVVELTVYRVVGIEILRLPNIRFFRKKIAFRRNSSHIRGIYIAGVIVSVELPRARSCTLFFLTYRF